MTYEFRTHFSPGGKVAQNISTVGLACASAGKAKSKVFHKPTDPHVSWMCTQKRHSSCASLTCICECHPK